MGGWCTRRVLWEGPNYLSSPGPGIQLQELQVVLESSTCQLQGFSPLGTPVSRSRQLRKHRLRPLRASASGGLERHAAVRAPWNQQTQAQGRREVPRGVQELVKYEVHEALERR